MGLFHAHLTNGVQGLVEQGVAELDDILCPSAPLKTKNMLVKYVNIH